MVKENLLVNWIDFGRSERRMYEEKESLRDV